MVKGNRLFDMAPGNSVSGPSRQLVFSGCRELYRPSAMDATEFRNFGKAAVDYIADYLENLRDR
jgi:hypothetical protein